MKNDKLDSTAKHKRNYSNDEVGSSCIMTFNETCLSRQSSISSPVMETAKTLSQPSSPRHTSPITRRRKSKSLSYHRNTYDMAVSAAIIAKARRASSGFRQHDNVCG